MAGDWRMKRALRALATDALLELGATKVISGMAIGWDTAIAVSARYLQLPLIAAIPFSGQEEPWGSTDQELYRNLLCYACEIVELYPPGMAIWKYHGRNRWMVDNCGHLAAFYEPGRKGGTEQCLKYAEVVGRPHTNFYPKWVSADGKAESPAV